MEESINPSPVPSNCTSSVCSDPAHDDLALDAEWSDENRDCDGDGPHRVVEDPEDLDVPDVRVHEDEDREVQQDLLRFSGAHAPEILKVTCTRLTNFCTGCPARMRSTPSLAQCLQHSAFPLQSVSAVDIHVY